jgi:hypothetical protein
MPSGAPSERATGDRVRAHAGDDDLTFPMRVSSQKGETLVQVQHTVHVARYGEGGPSPAGQAPDISGGERSIFEQ